MTAPNGAIDPIAGVFAFLDASGAAERAASRLSRAGEAEQIRILVDSINSNFRLQHWGCAVRTHLEAFGLYYRDDMADALARAYLLHASGADYLPALQRNYSPSWAILSIEEVDTFRTDPENAGVWVQFQPFFRDGDRILRYSLPGSVGVLLMRGLHRVWEVEILHMCVVGQPVDWIKAKEKFDALGGARGLLEGRFCWPPVPSDNAAIG